VPWVGQQINGKSIPVNQAWVLIAVIDFSKTVPQFEKKKETDTN